MQPSENGVEEWWFDTEGAAKMGSLNAARGYELHDAKKAAAQWGDHLDRRIPLAAGVVVGQNSARNSAEWAGHAKAGQPVSIRPHSRRSPSSPPPCGRGDGSGTPTGRDCRPRRRL